MRHINQAGLELIESFESLRLKRYLCPAGYWTIGYGHVIVSDWKMPDITKEDAEEFLRQDIAKAESAVSRLITTPLNDNQFSALVSFTFNAGAGALQRSTIRRLANRDELPGIPRELMKWVRGGGHVLPGLVRRRRAEGLLFMS